MGKYISPEEANKVWDVLCLHAGANNDDISRDGFIYYAIRNTQISEYRFQGALGFGGKVRKLEGHRDGRWHVYYYPEDRNEEREEISRRTNEALAAITAD